MDIQLYPIPHKPDQVEYVIHATLGESDEIASWLISQGWVGAGEVRESGSIIVYGGESVIVFMIRYVRSEDASCYVAFKNSPDKVELFKAAWIK